MTNLTHPTEIWKDVKGFEGIYKVSNHGRLMSFKGDKNGRVLRNTNKTGGYLSVVLEKGAYPIFSTKMHRLVATHFIPNPLNLPEVNHIDMNKQNNHVDNLEWVDRKTNHNHAVKNNPSMIAGMVKYNKSIRPKKIAQITPCGKVVKIHPGQIILMKCA